MALPKTIRYGFNLTLVIYCLLLIAPLQPQNDPIPSHVWQETGLPYIRNFSPKEYNGGIQNFTIVQDERGLVYFGNNSGVLIYDGVSWRLIKMPNRSLVRSLCLVKDRIYVGALGELGYLEPDDTGQLSYTSLLKEIPKKDRDFKDVYTTHAIGEAVYFRTRFSIFRWANEQVRVWNSTKQLFGAFVINDKYYSGQLGVGLMEMVEDSLQLLPGGEMFADKSLRLMIPYGDSQILIGTFAHGLFLYDGAEIKKFSTSIDEFLYENQLRSAANLTGGLIALATARGIVIIDTVGNFCQAVNKASGLRDELVITLFVDRQGGLWLGLNNGIARIETPAPISRFQARLGIESFVESIIRHQGVLYTTTDRGVRYLDATAESLHLFKAVDGISTLAWSFLSAGTDLLVGTQDAIFRVAGTEATRLNELSAITLFRSGQDSSKIFAGLLDGLAVLKWVDNDWGTLGMVSGVNERIISITEDKDGALWVGTQSQGVLRINQDFSNSYDGQLQMNVTRFGKEHRLPEGSVSPTVIEERLFFLTRKGLKHFDANRGFFIPDSTFGPVFADTLTWLNNLRADTQGNIWIVAGRGDQKYNGRAVRQEDGSYSWQETPFLRMNDLGRVYFSYPEADGTVWFGGSEGIARYIPDILKDYSQDYSTLIRRVRGIAADSIFYYGDAPSETNHPEIEYKKNSLRFEFAATSYDDPSSNWYQFRLNGFDEDWSIWINETKKDYTGLPAGDYTFRVRAKNVYQHQSSEGSFSFTILPPWFQTWWAYLVYMIFAGALVALIVKGRVRHLEKKTKELEATVADRTTQIVEQKNKIEEQAEKLREADKMKSRFFANISHEFRTPLTLIMGPLEERIAKARKKADKEELNVMHRSASRVLQLINQLLDLSRLESGKMKLKASHGDFAAFLKGIVMSFASLAEQKKITLKIEIPRHFESAGEFPEVYFDQDKIEKIFYNLLSNAFKFTPAGGSIFVGVGLKPTPTDRNFIEITVRDTGIGIPANRLPHVFDRFYQVDGTTTREHEGTGIGLALTKELVELHHGNIEVESKEGHGTTFTVRLPMGKKHLKQEEIVEESQTVEHATPATSIEEPASSIKEQPTSIRQPASSSEDIILIVDDHPDVRNYIRKHLESEYQVIEAKDGREGIDAATETIPDLVISDVMMPKMDGYQLCEALKTNEKTSHIPFILLTAKAGEADKLAGLEIGADDYLSKPFNSKELHARVHNLIESRRKLRERFRREGLLQPREVEVTSVEEAFLQKLMSVIEKNLAEEDFNPEALSNQLYMGLRQLQRKIRALTDQTPSDFIRTTRLQRAEQMLKQHAGSVSEIAYKVGFNDLSYFSKSFRKEFGILPSEIAKKTN